NTMSLRESFDGIVFNRPSCRYRAMISSSDRAFTLRTSVERARAKLAQEEARQVALGIEDEHDGLGRAAKDGSVVVALVAVNRIAIEILQLEKRAVFCEVLANLLHRFGRHCGCHSTAEPGFIELAR